MRDYGTGDDQLGLEPTFDLYIQHLCNIFDEVKRILRDDGTIWVNIGDTYGQNWRGGTKDTKDDYAKKHGNRYWKKEWGKEKFNTGVPPKSLVMIPFRFAIAMVNRGWILRNTIIWHKRNCMPSSIKDRFTVDFEYLFFFSKKKKYYFEQQFDKSIDPESFSGRRHRNPPSIMKSDTKKYYAKTGSFDKDGNPLDVGKTYPERNKRTVWTINPKPFSEAHFAVYPEELCEIPIKAGCPEFVCKKCGKPREIIYKDNGFIKTGGKRQKDTPGISDKAKREGTGYMSKKAIGYTNCGCNAGFEGGIVYDPFMGSGTTGLVAHRLNRNYILSEIKKEYCEIAEKRLQITKQIQFA